MAKISALVRTKLTRAQSLAAAGRTAEAIQLLEQVCRKDPRNADAWFMQGTILGNAGKSLQAIDCLQRATALDQRHVLAYFNLAKVLSDQRRFSEAVTALSRAQKLEPNRPEIVRALARAEVNCGRPREAARWYRQYLQTQPGDPEVFGNLGACYFHTGELEEAGKCYRQALALRSEAAWLDGLGATLCRQGKLEEAIEAHRAAVSLQPDNTRYRSNLLLTLHYLPDAAPAEILQEHLQWGRVRPGVASLEDRHVNTAEPGRRIRIGYVSPDFRTHSVSYFFEPLLRHHDSDSVETFCYACSPREDETTRRLQEAAHHWRNISMLDDREAIGKIHADGIDILVDLAGHTAGNRLPLFVAKPAPLQITWLGYPGTTGLEEIDYRITDHIADPEGDDVGCSEQLLRLDGCFLCYQPYANSPPVMPPPVFENGYVTFGSFNNLAKINEDVIDLWSALLQSLPESRILIKNPSLCDTATIERYLTRFSQHGISSGRIQLLGLAPDTGTHLRTYRHVDIALDTFPYNGTTTTCEALYMGVPVITLLGQAHAGRVGASLLSALGLEELVAGSHDAYLAVTKRLTEDRAELSKLRDSLRNRMSKSPLCDGRAFARRVEQAYRRVWRDWCASHAARQDL